MGSPQGWAPWTVGVSFTTRGALESHGLARGLVGGRSQSFGARLRGSGPGWTSRGPRLGVPLVFLLSGLGHLCRPAWSRLGGEP